MQVLFQKKEEMSDKQSCLKIENVLLEGSELFITRHVLVAFAKDTVERISSWGAILDHLTSQDLCSTKTP